MGHDNRERHVPAPRHTLGKTTAVHKDSVVVHKSGQATSTTRMSESTSTTSTKPTKSSTASYMCFVSKCVSEVTGWARREAQPALLLGGLRR